MAIPQNKFFKLVASISLPFIIGAVGSYFTIPSIDSWYTTLNKPSFNPPNFIFGPVWTTLYVLMGLSLYLILISKSTKDKNTAIKFFVLQLILNASWSIVFFGLHSPLVAFINIVLLWIFIFLTIRAFSKISKNASYLLYPYIFWVSFAAILNLSIVALN